MYGLNGEAVSLDNPQSGNVLGIILLSISSSQSTTRILPAILQTHLLPQEILIKRSLPIDVSHIHSQILGIATNNIAALKSFLTSGLTLSRSLS
jgi:hypothetical protein